MRGQLPIGSVLAGYRIIELIGEGAGGAVYLAEQEERGERVALKVLADELEGSSSSDSAKAAQPTTRKAPVANVGVKASGLIAFRRYPDATQSQGAVFTIKPDGTDEHQVTHPPAPDVDDQPAFSPDGSKIAFERCPTQDPKPCVAWVVNRDGSGASPLEVECPRPDCDITATTPSRSSWARC